VNKEDDMTYPPPGGTPDPYQPQQPYGQPYDPTAASPYQQPDPFAAPASGAPASGQPYSGQPYSGQPYAQPASDQPYGQPGQPYPGQYAAPGYPQYAQPAGTNTMAILALVFAFVFAPLAIVFGHMAKKQIRQTGEQGEGLATAGLWLGYIFTGLSVALCVLWGVLIAFAASQGTSTY
jgi:hypothetical protein